MSYELYEKDDALTNTSYESEVERTVRNNNKKVVWNRENTEKVIKLFKANRLLYDEQSEDYSDRIKKDEALDTILDEVYDEVPNVTKTEVRAKIQSLRSQLRKEVRAVATSKQKGINRRPKLWCFNHLKFLLPHLHMPSITLKNKDVKTRSECSQRANEYRRIEDECKQSMNEYRRSEIDCKRPAFNSNENKKIIWDRPSTEKLIKLFEANKCLYDVTDQGYNNEHKKDAALASILNELSDDVPNATIQDLRTKILSLLSQYGKVLHNIHSTTNGEEVGRSRLWCFDNLAFLRPHLEARRPKNNLEYTNMTNCIEETQWSANQTDEENELNPFAQDCEMIEAKIETETICSSQIEDFDDIDDDEKTLPEIEHVQINENDSDNEDEADLFAKTWALHYRSLSADQQIYAKKAIDDIFFEAKLGTLHRHSIKIKK